MGRQRSRAASRHSRKPESDADNRRGKGQPAQRRHPPRPRAWRRANARHVPMSRARDALGSTSSQVSPHVHPFVSPHGNGEHPMLARAVRSINHQVARSGRGTAGSWPTRTRQSRSAKSTDAISALSVSIEAAERGQHGRAESLSARVHEARPRANTRLRSEPRSSGVSGATPTSTARSSPRKTRPGEWSGRLPSRRAIRPEEPRRARDPPVRKPGICMPRQAARSGRGVWRSRPWWGLLARRSAPASRGRSRRAPPH